MHIESPEPRTESEFAFTHTIHAPRQVLYMAWTDPHRLAKWWGPHDFTNPVCELDVRPGGAYRIVMRGPSGKEYPVKGTYKEIVPDERLVMTDEWDEHPDDWQIELADNRGDGEKSRSRQCTVTVTFDEAEHGNTTKMHVHYQFESAADRNAMLKMGMEDGWSQSLERLDDLVAR